MYRTAATLVIGSVLGVLVATAAHAGGDWNDEGIGWQGYEEGLKKAAAEKKPVCLIFFTEWCPHCTSYSKVFHEPEVVEKSKKFVMVRLDGDKHKELGEKYKPDGGYIPRTFFLSPAGELQAEISTGRPKYKYFYSERDAKQLLASMDTVLAKSK